MPLIFIHIYWVNGRGCMKLDNQLIKVAYKPDLKTVLILSFHSLFFYFMISPILFSSLYPPSFANLHFFTLSAISLYQPSIHFHKSSYNLLSFSPVTFPYKAPPASPLCFAFLWPTLPPRTKGPLHFLSAWKMHACGQVVCLLAFIPIKGLSSFSHCNLTFLASEEGDARLDAHPLVPMTYASNKLEWRMREINSRLCSLPPSLLFHFCCLCWSPWGEDVSRGRGYCDYTDVFLLMVSFSPSFSHKSLWGLHAVSSFVAVLLPRFGKQPWAKVPGKMASMLACLLMLWPLVLLLCDPVVPIQLPAGCE